MAIRSGSGGRSTGNGRNTDRDGRSTGNGRIADRDRPGAARAGWDDPRRLVELKAGRRTTVCIPARDEAPTIAPIVGSIAAGLTAASGGPPLVDEVLVVDDGSTDRTGELASRSGARVVTVGAPGGGKGQAMRTGVEQAEGDLIVFLDADVTNFGTHFVSRLLAPLLSDDSITLVKGFYRRPLHGAPDGGGRVTELVAKPLIELLFPELAAIEQPLAGETASHRWVLEKCGLADGYAVELALLVDVAARFGVETVAQVDLGVRVHRNRPLDELRPQATDILRASLERARSADPAMSADGARSADED